ncbi:hypothetical protein BCR42DRAFT_486186 [Absidia repens]|uniref:PH domain-containing protein n=1 Tax=Absidia repens TaxID=90262 RepID=A0A1X2J2T5_9FUNG|nr:hypothetical protein BCR42DRAFT_486186 [Absidia repens]
MSSPKAAWLKKKTCTMGRTRWQSRFFVLLENELRYYKDEHAVTPKYIWNLREMTEIKQEEAMCCLSLKPRSSSDRHKSLMLQFPSRIEMQEWLDHLADRFQLSPTPLPLPRSSSLRRRRGIILSSLTINVEEDGTDNDDDDDDPAVSPSFLSSSPSSTISASSSASSIATLAHQEPPFSFAYPLHHTKQTLDDTASPTYLKYKNQFHL